MSRPLPIEYGAITPENVEELRKVNAACFPVSYNAGFYREIAVRRDDRLNKFAFYSGKVVGAVCTRLEPISNNRHRLYIMTLGVLAAYRGREVGTQLIQSILDYFEEERDGKLATVDEICLHVQTSNEDAIRFYIQRFGFVKGEIVENYYRRIDPPHCYLLFKKLRP
mmetsp:Transcript_19979/g.29605  ORF Transcript_19979/g.29605 Transcript_19979/m.29605 type:complete len:167 (-) Transcript_19979:138-638(-)